jgi:glycosyltransferase involved in cell wall biosynthesis
MWVSDADSGAGYEGHPAVLLAQRMLTPTLSVVVPCYNEQESIQACHERLTEVLSAIGESYEIVYVDDGSRDQTVVLLEQIHERDPHAVLVQLSRNFGHQPAVTAGLTEAQGSAVVIIDADLQDPPELIPEMVTLWRSGYKVVYGIRQIRDGETPFKLWTAKAFYRLINSLSDVEIPLDTGDFRLIDRVVVDVFLQMPERHRLLRGMWSWIGFPQVGLPYKRSPRFAGVTKYPLRKMLGLAVDGIVSFSVFPLRLVTALGFLSAGAAFMGIVYTLCVRLLTHSWVRGWAMTFIGILFMAGVQMLCLGILGEYIGRIYTESKQRPLFIQHAVRRAPQRGAEGVTSERGGRV